jgi:hypothetical protein
MPTYRFTANVPTRVEIDFIDVVGGEYGPQVRINGKFAAAGETLAKAYGYLPGKAPDSLTELLRAGVIGDMPGVLPESKDDKPLAVKPRAKSIMVTARQPAGQKYATTYAEVIGGAKPAPQAAPQAPAVAQTNVVAAPADYYPPPQETGAPPAQAPQIAPQGHAAAYSNPLYLSLVEFVRDQVVPLMAHVGPSGLEPSPESFAAMVNSLWIYESKR